MTDLDSCRDEPSLNFFHSLNTCFRSSGGDICGLRASVAGTRMRLLVSMSITIKLRLYQLLHPLKVGWEVEYAYHILNERE